MAVKIGDRSFANTEEALKTLAAEREQALEQAKTAMVAQQKAEADAAAARAAAASTPTSRPFKIDSSKYSLTHEKTVPALRGKLKGSIQITSDVSPFGFHIFPAQWDEMIKRKDEIDAYLAVHRPELDAALLEANRIKGNVKAGK